MRVVETKVVSDVESGTWVDGTISSNDYASSHTVKGTIEIGRKGEKCVVVAAGGSRIYGIVAAVVGDDGSLLAVVGISGRAVGTACGRGVTTNGGIDGITAVQGVGVLTQVGGRVAAHNLATGVIDKRASERGVDAERGDTSNSGAIDDGTITNSSANESRNTRKGKEGKKEKVKNKKIKEGRGHLGAFRFSFSQSIIY